jgi:hypothetical protein
MTVVWGLLAAAALLWPDHMTSWFDGAPLDRPAEAFVAAVIVPLLWALDPAFLKTRVARAAIVLLLAWRAFSSVALVQEGFCVRFQPSRPYTISQAGAPHSWDVRADWRSANPSCSAIMTRPYADLPAFPAWFFNLPPVGDAPLAAEDRPPSAVTAMTVSGFVRADRAGLIHVDAADNAPVNIRIDGGPESDAPRIQSGSHGVTMTTTLTGDRWRFVPLWNGQSPWSELAPTVRRGTAVDVVVRRWLRWLPTALVLALIGAWTRSFVVRVADLPLLIAPAAASLALAMLVLTGRLDAARWAVAALALAALVPVAGRNRNLQGAVAIVGMPWLVYVCARALPTVGRFTLYEWGNDFWTFQRYAYRIALQGFWLEGGAATFWFQPLYRWVVAVLHLVFGDSSAGEILWDGGCLLAGALWTYQAVRTRSRFGWSVAAAALSLALFILGTPRDLIGRGLGEITSSGFLYLAASLAMRNPADAGALVGAGICAVLGFYTRLNNLPMAAAVAAFAIPPDVKTRDLINPQAWAPRVSFRTIGVIAFALSLGAVLFAARTWFYTGVFSVFYGTQRQYLALWAPGAPLGSVVAAMLDSVMMVLTVNDPPRWDPYALPVLCGAAACLAALAGIPRLRDIPLSIVVFAAGSIAGALVARGSAYPGRFSIHVLPVMSAAFALGATTLVPALAERRLSNQDGADSPARAPRVAEFAG